MSELKAGVIVTPHDEGMCFDIGPKAIPVTERETEFYLKSEADKVIADKDKEIAELKEELKNSRNARKYWRKEHLVEYKECCHQKYKRCLAMARWCENAIFGWMRNKESYSSQQRYIKVMLYTKWRERWLKLAKEFKEVK